MMLQENSLIDFGHPRGWERRFTPRAAPAPAATGAARQATRLNKRFEHFILRRFPPHGHIARPTAHVRKSDANIGRRLWPVADVREGARTALAKPAKGCASLAYYAYVAFGSEW